jgi:hypothetical protein
MLAFWSHFFILLRLLGSLIGRSDCTELSGETSLDGINAGEPVCRNRPGAGAVEVPSTNHDPIILIIPSMR